MVRGQNRSTEGNKSRERSRPKKQGGRAAFPLMVLLSSPRSSLVWPRDSSRRRKQHELYHWGFPCFFSQAQTFPAHVGWAEGSQTPLSFTETHFPAEVQLHKAVSIRFICRRETEPWLLSAEWRSCPPRAASPRYCREAPAPFWAERGTLCQRLTARGQPSQGGMIVWLICYHSCPSAFSSHPHPGDIPSVFPAKPKKSQYTPITLLAYLPPTVELTFMLNLFLFSFSCWICFSANFTELLLDVQPLPQEQKKLGRCQSAENLTPRTCPNTTAKVSIQKLLFAGSALQRQLFLLSAAGKVQVLAPYSSCGVHRKSCPQEHYSCQQKGRLGIWWVTFCFKTRTI